MPQEEKEEKADPTVAHIPQHETEIERKESVEKRSWIHGSVERRFKDLKKELEGSKESGVFEEYGYSLVLAPLRRSLCEMNGSSKGFLESLPEAWKSLLRNPRREEKSQIRSERVDFFSL